MGLPRRIGSRTPKAPIKRSPGIAVTRSHGRKTTRSLPGLVIKSSLRVVTRSQLGLATRKDLRDLGAAAQVRHKPQRAPMHPRQPAKVASGELVFFVGIERMQ